MVVKVRENKLGIGNTGERGAAILNRLLREASVRR